MPAAAMLAVDAAAFDLAPALAGFNSRGYARLGRVVSGECLAALGARVDDLDGARRLHIHNHLWHCSGLNRSGRRRSALSVCLMTASSRCLRKKREPRRFVRIFD